VAETAWFTQVDASTDLASLARLGVMPALIVGADVGFRCAKSAILETPR